MTPPHGVQSAVKVTCAYPMGSVQVFVYNSPMEAELPKDRVCIYIDAANFYHIVLKVLSLGELDFDFDKFAEYLARGRNICDKRYYIGTVREEAGNEYSREAMSRQTKQLDLLKKSHWGINTSRLRKRTETIKIDGRTREYSALRAAGFSTITIERYREKGIDVKLATDLLVGALDDKYDVAILVSSDSDLIPAIDRVRYVQKKKIEYVGFSIENSLDPLNPTKPTPSLIEKSDIQNIILEEDIRRFVKPKLNGIVVKESLRNRDVLKKIQINNTIRPPSNGLTVHEVTVRMDQIPDLKKELNDGWYMHFWVPQHEKLLVLFRRKLFTIKTGDEKTLTECIAYAESIGIPKEHIDFSTK